MKLLKLSLNTLLCAIIGMAGLMGCATTKNYPPVGEGFYRVQKGDTLYQIARRHGRSVNQLTTWNRLRNPSEIEVGQVLRIRPQSNSSTAGSKPNSSNATASRPSVSQPPANLPKIELVWPAASKQVLANYDGKRSKGIAIVGQLGSPVYAAASGKVAYVGQGIRAYGHLVIIKHDNDYLTTYAHNQTIMVKEGQWVKQGQEIARMGNSGTQKVMLYFELRYKGNAINPSRYFK